ncbi:hypothetical protein KSS87_019337 [Heliosperma pusillum]|nr:hypothetical protein KSS87_019337 [Heliosperma pusillum]
MSSLRDELIATPPKLTLSSFPSHKLLPPTPGALTPPLHPMVSIPFQWEEVPGRPRRNTLLSPYKPKSFRCLELPPRLLGETRVAQMPSSPTTVLDGPKVGRTLSHRTTSIKASGKCYYEDAKKAILELKRAH